MVSRKDNLIGLFFLFLLGGGTLTFQGLLDLHRALAVRSWPSVEGTVVSSVVESHHQRGKTYFLARVTYSYTIDRNVYGGTSISSADPFRLPKDELIGGGRLGWKMRADAQRTADRYPVGELVPVFYDPESPRTSVLDPTVPARTVSEICCGIACLSIGLLGTLFCRSCFRRSRVSRSSMLAPQWQKQR
jgi:hypothetical protein